MNLPESRFFPYDREQLFNAIERFDSGLSVEDVVGKDCEYDISKYSNTVLIQVLLEFICHAFVKNEDQREKLLIEICKRLSKHKIVNDILLMDKSSEIRVAMKQKLIDFMKQVCTDVIPNVELDSSIVDFFESDNLSTDLKVHYHKNFVELEKVGQGGFGTVFKVESNLTKIIYAVKKIPFDYRNDARFLKVMREANNIATLDHPNIVRYHSAWIEMVSSRNLNKFICDGNSSSTSGTCKDEFQEENISEEFDGIVIKETSFTSDSSRFITSKQTSNQGSSSLNNEFVLFSNTSEICNEVTWTTGNNSSQGSDDESSNSESDNQSDNGDITFKLNLNVEGTLYIQMEFCECDLRFWMDKRAEGNVLPFEMNVIEIFTNILNGVSHIHSKGIIHRDLKPQNIFYSRVSNILKIGDFGLATLTGYPVSSSKKTSEIHSTAIGTLPYAAPEQLKSKKYDSKVDIYSLGIILIELMNTCKTSMELYKIITQVQNGSITEEMKQFPNLVSLVQNLISCNPEERMSAKEILNLFDKDSEVMLKEKELALKERDIKLKESEETIKNMKATILQKDLEISRLKAIISKLNIQSNE